MDHESLPGEHIEGPGDYVVVFKGGPNDRLVLPGDDPMSGIQLMTNGSGLLPEVGNRYQTASFIAVISLQTAGLERMRDALAKIGATASRMAIYEVESILDGVIVLAYQGDA